MDFSVSLTGSIDTDVCGSAARPFQPRSRHRQGKYHWVRAPHDHAAFRAQLEVRLFAAYACSAPAGQPCKRWTRKPCGRSPHWLCAPHQGWGRCSRARHGSLELVSTVRVSGRWCPRVRPQPRTRRSLVSGYPLAGTAPGRTRRRGRLGSTCAVRLGTSRRRRIPQRPGARRASGRDGWPSGQHDRRRRQPA